jgi:hypothetical protein
MNLGRRLGARYLVREGTPTVTGLNTVEGAVFALMGLVLAFAISGALQRFDERKQLILQETNAIGTAYDRLGLLENPAGLELKSALKAYLRARIDLYQKGIGFSFWQGAEVASDDRLARLSELKTAIWDGAVTACAPETNGCILNPSLNSTFERQCATVRTKDIRRMPLCHALRSWPWRIFLQALAWRQQNPQLNHMVIFAAALSAALFVVTDLEYPRLGLIRVNSFDHFLNAVYDQMQ